MNENDFNADLAHGLRSQGIFAHKLPDLARAVVKPCDIVANCGGRFWMIEGKLTKVKLKNGDFPPDLVVIDRYEKTFRPHQLPNLQKIQQQGGVGFVAVYLMEDRPGSRLKTAWLVPIDLFLHRPCWSVRYLDSTSVSFPSIKLSWAGEKKGWQVSAWIVKTYGLPR